MNCSSLNTNHKDIKNYKQRASNTEINISHDHFNKGKSSSILIKETEDKKPSGSLIVSNQVSNKDVHDNNNNISLMTVYPRV